MGLWRRICSALYAAGYLAGMVEKVSLESILGNLAAGMKSDSLVKCL